MSGSRNGTGREAGGRTGNNADRANLRCQKDCLMVHLGYSIWKREEQETVMAECRRWNMAGSRKLWSVVGIIYLEAHLGLGMGLVRVWIWGCD